MSVAERLLPRLLNGARFERRRFARRTIERDRPPARLPGHHRQLASMVDPVKEHEIPKHVPHADRLSIEERDRAIEVLDRQLLDALQRLAVNALERRRELSNGARP